MKYFAIPTVAAAAGSLMLAFGASAGDDMMQAMDTNKDGTTSATERAAGARLMFQRLDSDRDGSLSASELQAGHTGMKSDGEN